MRIRTEVDRHIGSAITVGVVDVADTGFLDTGDTVKCIEGEGFVNVLGVVLSLTHIAEAVVLAVFDVLGLIGAGGRTGEAGDVGADFSDGTADFTLGGCGQVVAIADFG